MSLVLVLTLCKEDEFQNEWKHEQKVDENWKNVLLVKKKALQFLSFFFNLKEQPFQTENQSNFSFLISSWYALHRFVISAGNLSVIETLKEVFLSGILTRPMNLVIIFNTSLTGLAAYSTFWVYSVLQEALICMGKVELEKFY